MNQPTYNLMLFKIHPRTIQDTLIFTASVWISVSFSLPQQQQQKQRPQVTISYSPKLTISSPAPFTHSRKSLGHFAHLRTIKITSISTQFALNFGHNTFHIVPAVFFFLLCCCCCSLPQCTKIYSKKTLSLSHSPSSRHERFTLALSLFLYLCNIPAGCCANSSGGFNQWVLKAPLSRHLLCWLKASALIVLCISLSLFLPATTPTI